jgi:hypothetical protein
LILAALIAAGSIEASAAPCQAHAGKAKQACTKQLKRDRMDWPPAPREWEIKRRIGWNWQKAERVAYCWPHQGATKAEQIAVGYVVSRRFGWRAWGCGAA